MFYLKLVTQFCITCLQTKSRDKFKTQKFNASHTSDHTLAQ